MPFVTPPPHLLLTGAAGFVAQGLLRQHLLPLARAGQLRLTLTDQVALSDQGDDAPNPAIRHIPGDVADPTLWDRLLHDPVDTVIHLAAVVSGQAERDYELGLRVNLHASLHGLERCRQQHLRGGPRVRWVQASSIAVWGTGLPDAVSDHTPVRPRLSYGAHKRMLEIMLHDLSRRGEVDGRSLRLSGVVMRPRATVAALSSFNSDLIRDPLQGRAITCPVRSDACIWLCSLEATVGQLWALAQVDTPSWQAACSQHGVDSMGSVVNAPTWPVHMPDLIQALGRLDPRAPGLIQFDPAAPLQAQFGHWPRQVDFALARTLQLPCDVTRHRGDLAAFVRACMATA